MRSCALLLAALLALAPAAPAVAGPVAVRFPEGIVHGFLVLRSARGGSLAHGEFTQTVRGDHLESTLVFRFIDGSLYDETVTFTQRKVFRLMAYKLVQRGPSFPKTSEVAFDRDSGRYRAREGKDTADGKLEIPEDLHNGLTGILLKNLPAGATGSGHIVAFTPKPLLVNTTLRKEGEDRFWVGDAPRTAARFLVHLDVPGLKGVAASLMGKDPPDLRYWIATGPVPAFLKFEGEMYLKGPRWTVELAAPRWPGAASR